MDRSLLARATEGTDAPTPGYLYLDIAKNAASSPTACQEMATYLTRRLSTKQNHNVKHKCLKVIAKTAESPVTRGQFKRAVAQDMEAVAAIKEALQFRGPPDPARGDEIYARVRAAAKEALDAVYSDTPSSTDYSGGGGLSATSSAPSSSFGPYSSGSTMPPAGAPRRMEGIGNPMFRDPRLDQAQGGIGNMTIGQAVSVAGETIVGMIKDPLARNIPDAPPPRVGGMPGYGSGGAYANPPGRSQLATATGGQWTMASNRGPNAVAPPQNFNAERDSAYYKNRDGGSNAFQWAQQHSSTAGGEHHVPGAVGGSWATASTGIPASQPSIASQARVPSYATPAPPTGSGGTAAADGSYEKNLILELCPPGGMKAEPPPDKLASFARAVPSLNPDLVCPALLDCLEEGQPWIIRAKALCVIETIIRVSEANSDDDTTNAYVDFFHACAGEIEPLASHSRVAIRDPATRVIRALGIDTGSSLVPAAPAPATQPPRPPISAPLNLLDFDDEPVAFAPPPPPPPAPLATPPTDSGSMFVGLKVQASKDQPTMTFTQPPLVINQEFENLLGDAPVSPSPAQTSSEISGGGPFADMTVKGAAPVAVDATAVGDVSLLAPPSGSAFGFINNEASADAQPAGTHEPQKSQLPTKDLFDPLLSGGLGSNSTTTKATMNNLSTAQMQAMAYQQMMMQQQMQQMQIALAMQQRGGGGGALPMMHMSSPIMQHRSSNPNVMNANASAAASSSFSFLDGPAPKKEDKTFDFVKDAMKNEGGKKK